MALPAHLEPIPHPPGNFLLGNMLDLGANSRVQDLMKLAREYGPIFELVFPGRKLTVVTGFELVDELCDEKRFDKKIGAALSNVRNFAGDGLFTAYTQEANWHKAHNILLPNFSMRAMQGYFPMMLEIADQLLGKWDRMNADDEIDVPDDMTRLTLDTIGLCGFDYRFNSFYRESMHPFVQSMVRALGESMQRLSRLPIEDKILINRAKQFQADIDFMNATVDRIIRERKESGENAKKKDLLSYMLSGVDKQSGEKLDDINIRYQIITFLIAGHETTSGLLSFATYFLLQNPYVLRKAYEEVDRVLGTDLNVKPTLAQVNNLHYVSQILKESLRLWPTAPAFVLYPYEDEVIGGKYQIAKGSEVSVLIPMLHRDKSIWGENAEVFDPEHFSPEAESRLPANAYKPFGNGQRACIGRQFAMQEATLVLGMILQRYQLIDHTHYQLKVKETLTLKPADFKIKVRRRNPQQTSIVNIHTPVQVSIQTAQESKPVQAAAHNTPLLVLYGSNMGTSEDIAHQIADDGEARGFTTTVASLDEYVNRLPTEGAVVIVTASYNGTPPDNAVKFCDWLKSDNLSATSLKNVKYTVFGCGNRDWAATFQAIPRLIDSSLEAHGATRVFQRGEGDAREDFDGDFQAWYQQLWPTLLEKLSIDAHLPETEQKGPVFEVEVVTKSKASVNPFVSTFNAYPVTILTNRELQRKEGPNPSERSTRHIEVALPEGVTYQTGHHLGVIARNNEELVRRVAARFGFSADTEILIHKHDKRKTHLPVDENISVYTLLSEYVELQDVAIRKQIKALLSYTECPPEKKKLEALCGDDEASSALYKEDVLAKRKSLIDLLEEYPSCMLPFNIYLEMLAPLRPRYYSISSSPLQQPDRCSITVGVVEGPARRGNGLYKGICSNYLNQMAEGSKVYAFVHDTKSAFLLPTDPKTPLIMVGPGTGLAPFRGFLQERATLKAEGKEVGPSLLFFGCRNPEQDFIYREELEQYAKDGITELFVAFSRYGNKKVYVQDKIREQKDRVWQLLQDGAIIYVCGDASKMAPDVRKTFGEIYQEKTGKGAEEAEQWLNELQANKRYLTDVWSSN